MDVPRTRAPAGGHPSLPREDDGSSRREPGGRRGRSRWSRSRGPRRRSRWRSTASRRPDRGGEGARRAWTRAAPPGGSDRGVPDMGAGSGADPRAPERERCLEGPLRPLRPRHRLSREAREQRRAAIGDRRRARSTFRPARGMFLSENRGRLEYFREANVQALPYLISVYAAGVGNHRRAAHWRERTVRDAPAGLLPLLQPGILREDVPAKLHAGKIEEVIHESRRAASIIIASRRRGGEESARPSSRPGSRRGRGGTRRRIAAQGRLVDRGPGGHPRSPLPGRRSTSGRPADPRRRQTRGS